MTVLRLHGDIMFSGHPSVRSSAIPSF